MSTSTPRILYVITDLELGGVPLHLSRLAPAMRDRGFGVNVATLAPVGPVGSILRRAGIEARSCNGCCGADFRVIPRLAEILEETQPALIHSFMFHANQAARVAAMLGGFPSRHVICEIQTVEVERGWHLRVERWMHRLSLLTIGNSPSVVEHLHRCAGIPQDRLRLVSGGIDVDRFAHAAPASREALGLSSLDRMILWVGRLDPVKGLDSLLHAIRAIGNQLPARLCIVGDGPERARLEALSTSLGLSQRVRFLGARNDIPSLLQTADVFALPSRTEGLPNALLEAMAAGRPIVTTDVAGCRDLIEHEETGLLVPYGDTAALATALVRLLKDRTLSKRLGTSAEEAVRTNWNIKSTFDAYESVYREALA